MGARFRYALEPVALQRQWAVDALQRTLGESNAALERQQAACEVVRQQLAQATAQWRALASSADGLTVERFARLAQYLAERRGRLQLLEQEAAQLEQARDAVSQQLLAAQRALDAVQEHRSTMRARFIRQRLSGEFKDADDHWSVLQAGKDKHDD